MKLTQIITETQISLKKKLPDELRALGYKRIINREGYIYAKGKLPVLLVAHLDTAHKEKVRDLCYSRDGNMIMSPQGVGGDDRCGVYMIMKIAKELKCHVLFCEDEEIGAIGAKKFCNSKISPNLNFIIEFDRTGRTDAVFYDCGNKKFIDFVCSFDFKEEEGSFSDISVIAPYLEIAAVNLSSGYYAAHTKSEYIVKSHMNEVIEKAKRMILAANEKYQYVAKPSYAFFGNLDDDYYESVYAIDIGERGGHVKIDGELFDGRDFFLTMEDEVYLFDGKLMLPAPEAYAFDSDGSPMVFEFTEDVLDIGEFLQYEDKWWEYK